MSRIYRIYSYTLKQYFTETGFGLASEAKWFQGRGRLIDWMAANHGEVKYGDTLIEDVPTIERILGGP